MISSKYPRWVTPSASDGDMRNLREVAPHLFVGSEHAPPEGYWVLVIDLCGSATKPENEPRYENAEHILTARFEDGTPIPTEYLDRISDEVQSRVERGPVLLHCAAGLSRSASVAFALLQTLYGLDADEALRRVKVPKIDEYPHPVVLRSAKRWVRERRR